jgi:thermitase
MVAPKRTTASPSGSLQIAARLTLLLVLLFRGFLLLPGAFAAQRDDYVPGEVLVGVDPQRVHVDRLSGILNRLGFVIGGLPAIQTYRVRLRPGISVPDAIARLAWSGEVAYAEPNSFVHPLATPNDPDYPRQTAPQVIRADLAWEIWIPRQPVVIAVVDTGIDATHLDLTGALYRGAGDAVVGYNVFTGLPDPVDDWPEFGHGTWCAGIAAAQINNGIGIAGIAGWNPTIPDSGTYIKIMPVKVLDAEAGGPVAGVAEGIVWAADHGARVINMSFGGAESATRSRAVEYTWARGCVLVAGAGNSGSTEPLYPAADAPVISVAATDSGDRLTSFSNYGPWVKVASLGEHVLGTDKGGHYINRSGTSASTAQVAAEAAMLLSQNPLLSNEAICQIILNHVDPYQHYYERRLAPGAGRINLYRAVQAAGVGIPDLTSITINPGRIRGGETTSGTVYLGGPAPEGGRVIALASSDPATAAVPESVTVPEGQTTARFPVATREVATTGELAIRATFENVTKSATLTTLPLGPDALAISRAEVTGGTAATGCVTLNGPAPEGGAAVALTSSQPSVIVPERVVVAAGATQAVFPVETQPVRSDQSAIVAVACGELREEALLKVRSPRPGSLTLSSTTVVGGVVVRGTITLTGPAPEGGVEVTLSADRPGVTMPPSAIVVAGETIAVFPIHTEPVRAARQIKITARCLGYARSVMLTINP